MSHFSRALLEIELWKNEVDQEHIITYQCTNDCDLDIYETYFINKYRPLYNKDKVFTKPSTFELPQLSPVIYNLVEEKNKLAKLPFQDSLRRVVEILSQEIISTEDKEILENIYSILPLTQEAIEVLGIKRINTLRFHKDKIEKEIHSKAPNIINLIKDTLLRKIKKNTFYTIGECKALLTDTYLTLNIEKVSKGKDILEYLEGKILNKRIDGILYQGCIFTG